MGLDINLYKGDKVQESNTEPIAYFRKNNALHAFVVKHFYKGNGDCNLEPVKLYREDLSLIINSCKEVLNLLSKEEHVHLLITKDYKLKKETVRKIEKIFPTMEGFFFGSTDYNYHYIQTLVETIKECRKLKRILTDIKNYITYEAWF